MPVRVRPVAPGSVALALAALCLTSACSWIFVQPPREDRGRGEYDDCTTSRAAPVIDTLFTLADVGSSIYVGTQSNATNKGAAIALDLGLATLWALSAGYGYSNTSACEEAIERSERSYYPPPHLRARPQFYLQPPPVYVPPPAAPPPADPPPPASEAVPQRRDNDEPPERPADDPESASDRAPGPAPARARSKKPPERLDAPRFGN